MLAIAGSPQRFCDGLSRRTFLRIGALGLGGLSMPDLLRAAGRGAHRSQKSIIMIYLPGGPPHLDLVDLKPDAPPEIRGSFRPIRTNVPGIQICELLPRLARLMDKLVLIRSLVGAENRHEAFQCYTGRTGGRPADNEPGGGWPTLGSVVSKLQGLGREGMPAYVDVGPKMGYGPYNNTGLHDASGERSWPGYLGFNHTPLQLEGQGQGDLVLNGITADRLQDRRALLGAFDRFRRHVDTTGATEAIDSLDTFRRQVTELRHKESKPDNYRLAASGFLAEVDRMNLEVREYLSLHPAEFEYRSRRFQHHR